MAQILVRDLNDEVKARLQQRAARHGRSMEAEVRDILSNAVKTDDVSSMGLGTEVAALFKGVGLQGNETIPELRGAALLNPFDP